ncbi:MAG: hypothetical protein HQL73_04870 [Magnetococcales bacterium]|nr:hypothetical protein [Magnetococcales bacterium]
MASNLVSNGVSIPLNDRAVQVSKRMALTASGVERNNLQSMINRGLSESASKAADTLNLNTHYQTVVSQASLGSHPRPEQLGRLDVTG